METHDINLAGRISHFFAVNRPLSILLLLVSLVFGLVSFFMTPKQYNPEITRPAFLVTIQYDGASTDEAIDRVVYELVEKVQTVPGVDDVYTEVHDGAIIQTTVIFEVGYDTSTAKLDLSEQLAGHSYLARGNINQPHIIEINPETIPVLQLVFGSDGVSVPELRRAVIDISHELQSVAGVSELSVYGGYAPTLTIEVDPQLLAEHHLTVETVTEVIRGSQLRTVSVGVRSDQYTIETIFDAVARTPEEIGNLLVVDGVRLRDVAQVYEGVGAGRSYVLHSDKDKQGEVVMLSVAKVEGESAPVVTEVVLQTLDTIITRDEFSGLTYKVVGNDGVTANTEIFGLTQNLISSIAIVAVVLLLFLSLRAALVVLVAIPVTLLVVFGLGFLFGQTINRITLFALILSLGLLVDSAIVAVENIYSRLRASASEPHGHTRERVIAGAIDEIGVGLLLSTLTSVIVFLPMNYITGMMGPYMGPIAFFVPAALIISFLVAIVVTPFIANHLLHVDEQPNRFSKQFGATMDWVTSKYTLFLRTVLASRTKQKFLLRSAVFVFLISLGLPMFGLVHFQMLPRADRDQFYVYLDLPVGTATEATKQVVGEITDIALTDADVVSVQSFVATPPILDFNGMFKGTGGRDGTEQATLRINLTPVAERDRSSTDIASTVRASLGLSMPEIIPEVRMMEEPPGPPVRATLVAKLEGQSVADRQQASIALQEFIGGVAGVVDTYTSDEVPVGRIHYTFDRAAADALGVSREAAGATMALLGGRYEASEWLGASSVEYARTVITVPATYLATPNAVDLLTVPNTAGEPVPLRAVVQTLYEVRPSTTYIEDSSVLSYVTAEVEDRSIVYVVIELIKKLIHGDMEGYVVTDWNLWGMTLECDDGTTIALTWGGEWEMTLENFRDLGIAMGVALLMVYALLVAQYNTFRTPAYILVTVPLGLVGILWGFLVLDTGFSIYLTATALIGFIALIGIVVNNAIIYLEYVEQATAAGARYEEALLAAGEARLRPIFLTSLTTVLGSLTIASDPVWSGLAWSIVFGLSLSTVLTLVIYPTLLVYFKVER